MSLASLVSLVNELKETIEKKNRNLLKRKTRLDQYRGSLSKGNTLKPDQAKAVEKYESVTTSIAVLSELMESTNDFNKKILSKIESVEKETHIMTKSQFAGLIERTFVVREFLEACRRPEVIAAVKAEHKPEDVSILQNLIDLSQTKTSFVSLSKEQSNVKTNPRSASYVISQLCNASAEMIPDAKSTRKWTKSSYKYAHDLCASIMENRAIASTIDGVPYVSEVPTVEVPACEVKETVTSSQEPKPSPPVATVPEELVDGVINPVNSRFNFFNPSSVSVAQPQAAQPSNGDRISPSSEFSDFDKENAPVESNWHKKQESPAKPNSGRSNGYRQSGPRARGRGGRGGGAAFGKAQELRGDDAGHRAQRSRPTENGRLDTYQKPAMGRFNMPQQKPLAASGPH